MPEATLQPAAAAGIDTSIREDNATTNYGTTTSPACGFDSSGNNYDFLIKFDLSTIEPGSIIEQATLSLYVDGSVSLAFSCSISRILSGNDGWTEAGATWNTKDGSNAWVGGVGAEVAGVDYSATDLYTMSVHWVAGWNAFALNVSEFQALIDVGNYGIKVHSLNRSPSVDRSVTISSSDHATAAQRPKLYVRWIAPSRRVYEYTFNIEDARGLIDSKGQEVDPIDIEVNKWGRTLGIDPPLRGDYDSMVEHPNYWYIVSKTYNEDQGTVRIKTDRNQFADALINKILQGS